MNLTIYDNQGETFDRYTVFNNDTPGRSDTPNEEALMLSLNCDSPSGISMLVDATRGEHLGDIICFDKLPSCVQTHIKRRLKI